MIAKLTGVLDECELTSVLVDVNGVGYELAVPISTYDMLPRPGGSVSLFTHLHVREDALQLYGFATKKERGLFVLLMTVSGIGTRIALNILSCMSVDRFCQNILESDLKALSKVNGIGKRSAERLILELKGKVGELSPAAAFGGETSSGDLSQAAQDAVTALETLGFKTESARKAVRACLENGDASAETAEGLIRKALGLLNS
ncbi:MAG: Holliday junction branch migration protein RuvA [Lentisphaeria bacterium]|nr:Holliday junction branch migration protein RuvA [Lentisphaeria bacterium]